MAEPMAMRRSTLRRHARARRYHLQHPARTQQEDDPDRILSAPVPNTSASYRRKFWRDLTGQTGYAQRKHFRLALGDPSLPLRQRTALLEQAWTAARGQCAPAGRSGG